MNSTRYLQPGERALLQAGRYLTAVVATAAACWTRGALEPWLHGECPFSLFFLSTLFTAWLCGTGPGCFAAALGVLAAAHFFIPPQGSLLLQDTSDKLSLTVYAIVTGIVILLFDRVARQRRAVEGRLAENERLSDSLRDADRRKDDFLALLAHELRNPLASIQNSVALLEREPATIEAKQRARDAIRRQSTHLTRLIDDLLDISRMLKGRVELRCERFDLRRVVDDALEAASPSFEAKKIEIRRLRPSEPTFVYGDPIRIAQAVSNLLDNAAKYTPARGRVVVELASDETSATLIVADNGIGFPTEERERIFEPFLQIDPSRTRDYQGLGLGLSLVSQIARLHGGSAKGFSRGPGLGSTFTLCLPLASGEASPESSIEATSAKTPSPRPRTTADRGPKTVLLVEDNADALASMQALLEFEGFQALSASDAYAALALADSISPDVVVMDIGLPGMDGYELARRLRSRPRFASARFIALTGWGAERDRRQAIEAGFQSHLVKPVDFDRLLDILRSGEAAGALAEPATVSGDDETR